MIGRQGALCGNMNFSVGKAYFTEHAVAVKANENNDTKFLYYLLDKMNLGQYSDQSAQPGLAVNKLSALKEFVPRKQEQIKISSYLKGLDHLITLHQRKYEKLLKIKKSMLENMFPKDGETKPKIRFSGFTDDWEQRKLGEFLSLSKIQGHTGIDAKKLTVKLWSKGIVEKSDIFGGSKNTQYYIRHAGQFMYGKLDFLHSAFGIVPKKLDGYESTLDSPAFDLNGIKGSFLLNRVSQKDFYLKNGMIANGSRKAKRIHENTFLNMSIMAPLLIEQERIGEFLDNLDTLITLHQRKLEKLEKLKKSMLENMFV